jgi:hypothetical protein
MAPMLILLFFQAPQPDPLNDRFPERSAGAWTDRAFGLAELTESGAFISGGGHVWMWDASVSTFGFDLYRETGFRSAAAMTYGDLRLGLAFETRTLTPKGFARTTTHGIDAWIRVPLGPSVRAGVMALNLNGAAARPAVWTAGASTAAMPTLSVAAWMWLDAGHPPDARFLLAWTPVPALGLDITRHTDPLVWRFRATLHTRRVRTRFTVRTHPVLGWSQAAEVAWHWH